MTVEPFIGARFLKTAYCHCCFLPAYSPLCGGTFQKNRWFSAGAMAIVALVHDALIVTAVFVVFKIPLNDSFIAAILTIIGFSINDT